MKDGKPLTDDARSRYLLSFLAILVDRVGVDGVLTIEDLSEYARRNLLLKMDLDVKGDRVVLTLYVENL